jgi:putative phage-type endonuclease
METHELKQGTDEWRVARLGKVTASRVADVIAKTKTGYSSSRENYMAQLICERMTNQFQESYTNAAMIHGTATEPLARAAYEAHANVLVDEVGIIDHPFIPMSAASPDGLVSIDGMLEIKCPNTATHFDTLLKGEVPSKYSIQMQWQMACANRLWCDFVSFDPRAPEGLQLFVKRVDRNDAYILELETEINKFLEEMDKRIEKLNQLKAQNV